jgi:hypothetical protein
MGLAGLEATKADRLDDSLLFSYSPVLLENGR